MGLFRKKKKEEIQLADNEFKFKMLPLSVLSIEGSQLKQTFRDKKGNLLSETSFNLDRVDSVSHKVSSGPFYKISIHFLDKKKPFEFQYDTKKEQKQADVFLSLLNKQIQ